MAIANHVESTAWSVGRWRPGGAWECGRGSIVCYTGIAVKQRNEWRNSAILGTDTFTIAMHSKLLCCLLGLVVVSEGIVLDGLILRRSHATISSGISVDPDPALQSPLYGALKYGASDATFERLVKQYPNWIPFRPTGATNSILGACAELRRTNWVRILIANGASVKEAIDDENQLENGKAVKFLEKIPSAGKQ